MTDTHPVQATGLSEERELCGDPVPGLKPSLCCTLPKDHEGTHGTDGVVWRRMTVEFRNAPEGR